VDPQVLGVTLMHEHIFLDMARVTRDRAQRLYEVPLSVRELTDFAAAGGSTIVEVTNRQLGRRPDALAEVARATGLHIVMGCGWYREPYYTQDVWTLPTSRLAEDIIAEITDGVGEHRVRPGIIGEIGSDDEYISPVEEKSFRAAARAHLATGLTITTHASRGRVGLAQLDLLMEEGVAPDRVIIGHCDATADTEYHGLLTQQGVWVQFDLIHDRNPWERDKAVRLVCEFLESGHLHRLLLSHDVCKRGHLTTYGGTGYAFLLTEFATHLKAAGVSDNELATLLVANPRAALIGGTTESPSAAPHTRAAALARV
jgi:predicted metal-dependent phosphotriesterase family hydrolase